MSFINTRFNLSIERLRMTLKEYHLNQNVSRFKRMPWTFCHSTLENTSHVLNMELPVWFTMKCTACWSCGNYLKCVLSKVSSADVQSAAARGRRNSAERQTASTFCHSTSLLHFTTCFLYLLRKSMSECSTSNQWTFISNYKDID